MMCGRYTLSASKEELKDRYQAEIRMDEIEEREEIFPTTMNVVLLPNYIMYPVRWGFTPSFTKQPIINARSETILEKPLFKEPFQKKRCIIPATSFFEWEKAEGNPKKIKREIRVKDQPIFSIAGICERFPNEKGENMLSYTILTTEANEQLKQIHSRMPVLLHPYDEKKYLDVTREPQEVAELLFPYAGKLTIQ